MNAPRRTRPSGILLLIVTIAACALLPMLPISDFYIQQAFMLLFFAGLAQSWNILGGYAGYLSLGHSSFVGIGGYTVASLYFVFGWSPFITFPLAAVVAGLLALIIGLVCLRIRGSYFLIATMLVLFIMQTLALNLPGLTNGAAGIDLPLFTSDILLEAHLWYYIGLALVIVITAVAYWVEHSPFGLNLMAIREDEDVARTMGVRVVRCKAIAFVTSASLAGLLGAFYTYRAHLIEPFSAFSVEMAAAPIMMAILGGSRDIIGPLIGAVIYYALSTALALSIGNEYSDMLFAVFLIGVVLMLPEGIMGLAYRLGRRNKTPEVRSGPPQAPASPHSVLDHA